ncbi:MAG: hypothetical protein LBR66_03495 [Candidatus Symbiothrix sp.]|jgi:hypothetical protein|nr:hypothetical protein [Candidatus Symbiothrix sp.]
MKKYIIRIKPEARTDIRNTQHFIAYTLLSPLTSERYVIGIYQAIYRLSFYGGSIAPSLNDYIQANYGPDARTITYKKMSIIYNITDDIIYVRRVIAGSLIK